MQGCISQVVSIWHFLCTRQATIFKYPRQRQNKRLHKLLYLMEVLLLMLLMKVLLLMLRMKVLFLMLLMNCGLLVDSGYSDVFIKLLLLLLVGSGHSDLLLKFQSLLSIKIYHMKLLSKSNFCVLLLDLCEIFWNCYIICYTQE